MKPGIPVLGTRACARDHAQHLPERRRMMLVPANYLDVLSMTS